MYQTCFNGILSPYTVIQQLRHVAWAKIEIQTMSVFVHRSGFIRRLAFIRRRPIECGSFWVQIFELQDFITLKYFLDRSCGQELVLGLVFARKVNFVTRGYVGPDILKRHWLPEMIFEVLEVVKHN